MVKILVSILMLFSITSNAAPEKKGRVIKVFPENHTEDIESLGITTNPDSFKAPTLITNKSEVGVLDTEKPEVYKSKTIKPTIEEQTYYLNSGWLRESIKVLAKEFDIQRVVFAKNIPECVDWKIQDSYVIPKSDMMEVLMFALNDYGLIPKYHPINNVLLILSSRDYKDCSNDNY